jgi:hypothetical protein
VISGVGLGLTALYQGFEEGVTGLVVNPYEGAMKDGVGGFVKGAFKGNFVFIVSIIFFL